MDDFDQQIKQAEGQIAAAATIDALETLRVSLLGKQGFITQKLKQLGGLPPEQRKAQGASVNIAKDRLSSSILERKDMLERQQLASRLLAEKLDVSMPGRGHERGFAHPISQTVDRILDIFSQLGYARADGPEIEDDYHNFTALNFPPHHPARAMHDTFYFPDGRLLRTHTSPVQVRAMKGAAPPFKIIAAGKVYRSDSDQTHSPMFHQVEGFYVAEKVSFADLKGTLALFIASFFERDFKMQFRPSYFPFTEPSAEVDIEWTDGQGGSTWLEVLGCGMVHPNVLRGCGIDAERYTGFAFGLGVERFAMLRHGVKDLRAFFENDLRFLRQFA